MGFTTPKYDNKTLLQIYDIQHTIFFPIVVICIGGSQYIRASEL